MKYSLLIYHIKSIRLQSNLTQLYVSKQLGSMDEDFYGRIERFEKEIHLYCLIRIAHALNVSPIILLHISDYECFSTPHLHQHSTNRIALLTDAELHSQIDQFFKYSTDLHAAHFYIRLYRLLKNIRRYKHMSTKSFSMSLGYSSNHFSKLERENKELSIECVFRICSILNMSFAALMIQANCNSVFTNKSGQITNLTYMKQQYPDLFKSVDV